MTWDVFRLVIISLASALLSSIIGIITLAVLERPIPDVLQGLALATLTGITGLLARHPADRPTDVTLTGQTAPVVTRDAEYAGGKHRAEL